MTRELLAIDGGTPVRKTLLPTVASRLEKTDIQAVTDVLRSDGLPRDPRSRNLKRPLAAWVGAKHAVSFSSGTAAFAMERPSPRGSSPVMKPSPRR